MRSITIIGAAAALVSCSGEAPDANRQPAEQPDIPQPSGPPVPAQETPAPSAAAPAPEMVWGSVAGGGGTTLRLTGEDGIVRMSIACMGDPARLVVNVPEFRPVMSEDRFALGLGSEPVTLVANPYEQEAQPGVTGEGPVPDNLRAFVDAADEVRALYGAQQTGPYPAPAPELKQLLIQACEGAAGQERG